ncbi:hypothetical protein, unlikely [Trypanosoma brucei gambiense DAL972]|uniref:Uncharacterized protein n=1 Tax=Trypanosoma brucei gambiense (strain MHOM/CI/86/DAL972) TaxID=679716 RepID=C9ZLN6_TRYB9|nr:hypothetical protein, unlikely [Trypanosoma brucei gambiense DAL972]CBH10311.1 hypothetical protein, unlikely [Trypanosoma brucei gambiense DAL972]|eukprot:XP_011772601.1 hypothetical protein, unlikely [Trypanosoma brucei gambiense DAL972]
MVSSLRRKKIIRNKCVYLSKNCMMQKGIESNEHIKEKKDCREMSGKGVRVGTKKKKQNHRGETDRRKNATRESHTELWHPAIPQTTQTRLISSFSFSSSLLLSFSSFLCVFFLL